MTQYLKTLNNTGVTASTADCRIEMICGLPALYESSYLNVHT